MRAFFVYNIDMRNNYDIAVIGAGASGMASAIAAARKGAKVIIIEKNHIPGRKILSTGSGKCNFSNEKIALSDYNEEARDFVKQSFKVLPKEEIIKFFEELGLLWIKGEKGKLFPRSLKAKDVVNVLAGEIKRLGIELMLLTKVENIVNAKPFKIETVSVPAQWENKGNNEPVKKVVFANKVIVSAGSPCCSRIGGSDSGYDLLKNLKHNISDVFPVITPLCVKEKYVKEVDGVRLNAGVKFICDENMIYCAVGELLFTKNGLSGPVILDGSRAVLSALKTKAVFANIDFFYDYSESEFKKKISDRIKIFGDEISFADFSSGLHNEKLINLLKNLSGIKSDTALGKINKASLNKFICLAKSLNFEFDKFDNFEDAAAAAGGVDLSQINPLTFESLLVKNLYVTGELLNVDGRSGGFNLHFAWTSGIIAGRDASSHK